MSLAVTMVGAVNAFVLRAPTPLLRDQGRRWLDLGFIWLLTFIYLAPFVDALPFMDGVRDIKVALDISRGDAYPLVGPVFASRFHLGPVFYYVEALPLLLGFPLMAVPLFLGALASAKFALAFGFGRDLIDRRYGLLFAAGLALPGWSGLDFLNSTTPLLVPALSLVVCWCTLRYWRNSTLAPLLGAALAGSLALHAHPSAVVVVLPAAVICGRRALQNHHAGWLLGALMLALLPLLAAAAAVSQMGWTAVFPAGDTVVVPGAGHSVTGWAAALRGFALGGPLTTLHTLGSERYGQALAMAVSVIAASGLCLLALQMVRDRSARWLVGALLAALVVVFGARPSTPWYFMQILTLAYAAAVAYGWRGCRRTFPLWLTLALILAGAQSYGVIQHLRRGEGGFASVELMDVRSARGERGPPVGAWISVRHWDKLASLSCPLLQQSLAIHGELAGILDDQGALALRGRCEVSRLRLGGQAPRHWVGIPRAIWSKLGWAPSAKIGSLGIFDVDAQNVVTTAGQALADPADYPMRAQLGGPVTQREYRVSLAPGELLLVSRLSPALAVLEIDSAQIDGVTIAPFYRDAYVHAFLAPVSMAGTSQWTLKVSSTAHDWVDIVTLGPGRPLH